MLPYVNLLHALTPMRRYCPNMSVNNIGAVNNNDASGSCVQLTSFIYCTMSSIDDRS